MPYHSGNQLVDVQDLLAYAQVFPGMHAADFGCGRTGHITFPLARALGERGLVYAVDILKDVLENTQKRAADSGYTTIHTVWADLERMGCTAIPSASLDAGFLVNTLSQAEKKYEILDEIGRLLKEKARLVICDWGTKGLPFGPDNNQYVDFSDIEEWAPTHGFILQERFDMGPYHHGLVLYRHM